MTVSLRKRSICLALIEHFTFSGILHGLLCIYIEEFTSLIAMPVYKSFYPFFRIRSEFLQFAVIKKKKEEKKKHKSYQTAFPLSGSKRMKKFGMPGHHTRRDSQQENSMIDARMVVEFAPMVTGPIW